MTRTVGAVARPAAVGDTIGETRLDRLPAGAVVAILAPRFQWAQPVARRVAIGPSLFWMVTGMEGGYDITADFHAAYGRDRYLVLWLPKETS